MNEPVDIGVSVLILSYNHSKYIEKAIESVFAQSQFVGDIELVVLDDGSTDGTPEILKRVQEDSPIPMRLMLNKHEGYQSIAKNFNKLATLATKKYVAFLASDDFYFPDRFTNQISIMERDEAVQFVYANGINFLEGRNIGNVHPDSVVKLLRTGDSGKMFDYTVSGTPQLYIQSILVRRSFFFGFSPFDDNLIADDWVFNIRGFSRLVDLRLRYSYTDDVVFGRNVLPNSTSNNVPVHFKRVAQTAEIYIPHTNRKFYVKFYWKYIKLFLRKGRLRSSIILGGRLALLPFSFHNKRLSSFI